MYVNRSPLGSMVYVHMNVHDAQQLLGQLDALIEDAAKGGKRHIRDVMDEHPQVKELFNAVHRAVDHPGEE